MQLSKRGNHFSLSPGERAGVRAGFIYKHFALGFQWEGGTKPNACVCFAISGRIAQGVALGCHVKTLSAPP